MKIFTAEQIREIDRLTILREPISSYDLMERAASKIFLRVISLPFAENSFTVIAGPGNNGGDGLVIARLLAEAGKDVSAFLIRAGSKLTDDCLRNFERLAALKMCCITVVDSESDLPVTFNSKIIIDALFGTGLSREPEDLFAKSIELINSSGRIVISVDLPSGLSSDLNKGTLNKVVKADYTFVLGSPRLPLLLPETGVFAGEWELTDIGLDRQAIAEIPSEYEYTLGSEVAGILKRRGKFSHKGTYGHGLLLAGSDGKTGAAVLAAGGALRSGIGLLTVHLPAVGYIPLQAGFPEAMISRDPDSSEISELPSIEKYSAAAFGPGTGTGSKQERVLYALLKEKDLPLAIDADGINILSANRQWLKFLRPNAVLTPHPGEFDRLTAKHSTASDRLKTLVKFSQDNNCTVVLKGAYTSVAMPEGRVYFNSTGNNGMATGGSGDVLTGIILSLLSQGYKPGEAAVAGTWIHGKAGDFGAGERGYEALIATDIIDNLGKAFKSLYSYNSF